MRIVIELDPADGRATVTTEPHPQGVDVPLATASGADAAGEPIDAGPPADGKEAGDGAGRPVDGGAAPDVGHG